MRFRAVFFDVGETLVHVDPSFSDLFVKVLAEAGHERTLDDVRNASAHIYASFSEAARDRSMWTTSPDRSRTFWMSVYARMLEDLGVRSEDGLASTLHRAFTRLENYVLFDDVRPALSRLATAGLLLGVVSNFEAWLERLLERLGVRSYFDVRAISGVEARESVYVGDNPEFDVDPPAALGMFPVLVDRRERFPEHRGPRVRDLRELPSVLEAA